ncbi:MAG: YraN family protein [Lysobacter sp.]|nr:MAG: YraN family protein [Lysobacter sp.]
MANLPRSPTRAAEPAPTHTRARGAQVEAAARDHLVRHGLTPVASNATYRFGELDLVMQDRATLVFVEVRFRAGGVFGDGAQSISASKRRKLVQAANAFLGAHPRYADVPCRFDVIDASGDADAPTLHWLRDAFRADDA